MNRETIYLAALLHDIGKFWQRADTWYKDSKLLDQTTKDSIGIICPVNGSGGYSHLHVLWTKQFFESNSNIFKRVKNAKDHSCFDFDGGIENPGDSLINLASFHHRPASKLQALIQLADWISSGIDRREENDEKEGEWNFDKINYGSPQFKRVPLFSIFQDVQINGKKERNRHCYTLEKMDLNSKSCFFPNPFSQKTVKDLSSSYASLWAEFVREFQQLPNKETPFLESLHFLLKKYTWSIPSSTTDMANVSLFEHLKNTAAIADCLFEYMQEHEEDFIFEYNKLITKPNVHPLLFVCCDISGIQSFIYNIASSKAAASLKGRSFYIQLVQEVIQREVIAKTGAQSGHIIYGSGGKFYMLLPNTQYVKEALSIARDQINLELWKNQKQKLYACLDWIPFCYRTGQQFNNARIECSELGPNGLEIKNLGELWLAATEKAAAWKGHKYDSLVGSYYDLFFGKDGKGIEVDVSNGEVCAVTGEEGALIALDNDLKVLPTVKEQIDFGRSLKDFDYMILLDKSNGTFNQYYEKRIKKSIQPLGDLGFTAYFLSEDKENKAPISSIDFANVIQINDTNFLKTDRLKGIAAGYGFRFFGGNTPSLKDNGLEKTYEDLVLNDDEGDSFLGVLRMDIDGLGDIFKNGFNPENKSFSAYATLSNALDYFFSGYINEIRNRSEFKNWINIIYSGGDDLFAVGRWSEIISFAEAVRKDFLAFVGDRQEFSISGGIALIGKKYPISLGAEEAGNYEAMAKNYRNNYLLKTQVKNALCLFGQVVSWETEFPYVKKLMQEFYHLSTIEKGKISSGLLQKLIELNNHKNFLKSNNSKTGNDYSYRWNAAYYLARSLSRFDKTKSENTNAIELIKKLQQEIFTDHMLGEDRYLELAALASRWTEFHIKENIKPIN